MLFDFVFIVVNHSTVHTDQLVNTKEISILIDTYIIVQNNILGSEVNVDTV